MEATGPEQQIELGLKLRLVLTQKTCVEVSKAPLLSGSGRHRKCLALRGPASEGSIPAFLPQTGMGSPAWTFRRSEEKLALNSS